MELKTCTEAGTSHKVTGRSAYRAQGAIAWVEIYLKSDIVSADMRGEDHKAMNAVFFEFSTPFTISSAVANNTKFQTNDNMITSNDNMII